MRACGETSTARRPASVESLVSFSRTNLVVEILGPLLVHAVAEVDHDVVEHCRLDVLGHLESEKTPCQNWSSLI